MKIDALRLRPDQDLRQSIQAFAAEQAIEAGFVLTAVGSLKQAALRFANQPQATVLAQKFELVSLVGTVSVHGLHLHLAIADATGTVLGGHLMPGCLIYTTAELVLGSSDRHRFIRQPDATTGFLELQIESLGS